MPFRCARTTPSMYMLPFQHQLVLVAALTAFDKSMSAHVCLPTIQPRKACTDISMNNFMVGH